MVKQTTNRTPYTHKIATKRVNEYIQLSVKPTPDELGVYYKNIYFQQSKGSYQRKYSKAELHYINNCNIAIVNCVERIARSNIRGKTFLDLGAGEGWALKTFYNAGCVVTGVDFTSFAISRFNKGLKKYFFEDDIINFVNKCISTKRKFDIVNLTNVIEHVIEPEKLLFSIKKLLSRKGIIVVTFPNDFSELHNLLLSKRLISHPFWVASPDHISYFNKESFSKMSKRLGFDQLLFCADFPIDLFLLNETSNYVNDRSKGKQAHLARVDFINMINKMNKNTVIDFLTSMGELGIGRNLTAFLRNRKK